MTSKINGEKKWRHLVIEYLKHFQAKKSLFEMILYFFKNNNIFLKFQTALYEFLHSSGEMRSTLLYVAYLKMLTPLVNKMYVTTC